MEENVALDSKKKKKFLKSIKGIKKLIQKNDKKELLEKHIVETTEKKKITKKIRPERGLVYLSHIPHGFYEHQMTEYFKQFGAVSNVRVIRSKRTGRSKGFAFIEFKEPSVAQIVAETMNNYLMGKRLLKAAYIPPEKIRRHAKRKNWSEVHNPAAVDRIKHKKSFNAVKDENEDIKKAKKMLSNLQKTKSKLSEFGINYDFFMPVDVPLELIKVKEEKDDKTVTVKEESDKKDKPTKKEKKEQLNYAINVAKESKPINKAETFKEVKPKDQKQIKSKKDIVQKVDRKEQEQKQKKLDKAGVKDIKNFIKVPESENDSESSVDFDSDEYEKILSDESEYGSDEGGQSDKSDDDGMEEDSDGDDNGDEDDEPDSEESVVDFPPVKPKGKAPLVLAPKKNDNQEKQQKIFVKNPQVKRKAPQKTPVAVVPVAAKKPKFEKQSKPIPVKKQFKKKK